MGGELENRVTGTIVKIVKDYGFISTDSVADQDVYFKTSWYRGDPPLKEGDVVTFGLRWFDTSPQAYHPRRKDDDLRTSTPQGSTRQLIPTTSHIFDWAYLGYLPNVLSELQGLALKEQWEFKHLPKDPNRPLPILHSYLHHTYGRLVLEKKVAINEHAKMAAFNTGLVDHRYEPLYALFEPNDSTNCPWQLRGFCIAGEDANGQNLVRYFNPLPDRAHYFDQPADLLYDTRMGEPEIDWRHLVIERIDRFPNEFIEDHWPRDFAKEVTSEMSENNRRSYFARLGHAVEADMRAYRMIINRVKDAVGLAIKRVSWNFKAAVPQYYPRVRQLQLLLPVCLVSDERVDVALAVEKTESGKYLGHTILPLDWAYRNARLICRPDSDWLEPDVITTESVEEEDSAES